MFRTATKAAQRLNNIRLTSVRSASIESCLKTPLFDKHVASGGKMVPFAGYAMPVQYPQGLMAEHNHCRSEVVVFDVSHMGPCIIHGRDSTKFLESLVVADLQGLPSNQSCLSLLTTPQATIIDDCIVSNVQPSQHFSSNAVAKYVGANGYFVVLNAGCKEKDLAHIESKRKEFGGDVSLRVLPDLALIALQGPKAHQILSSLCPSLEVQKQGFMSMFYASVGGIPCQISRSGYTGEDGFEIACLSSDANALWDQLLSSNNSICKPAGLGSRDSLRLEAGMCLYGNDIDNSTTLVEAGLVWTVGKRRLAEGGFPGFDVVVQQRKDGPSRRRVGLVIPGTPARAGTTVHTSEGNEIGKITSGGFSVTLKQPIAMAYVAKDFAKAGTQVKVSVRGKMIDATVSKMPFVQTHYHKV